MRITTTGTAIVEHAPQRAVIHLSVSAEDPSTEVAIAAVTRAAEQVRDLAPDAEIDALTTHRWQDHSTPQARVTSYAEIHCRIPVPALADLPELLAACGEIPHCQITDTRYSLTPQTQQELREHALDMAYAAAQRDATTLARSCGFGPPSVVSVRTLDHGPALTGDLRGLQLEAGALGAPLNPAQAQIQATVEAEFQVTETS